MSRHALVALLLVSVTIPVLSDGDGSEPALALRTCSPLSKREAQPFNLPTLKLQWDSWQVRVCAQLGVSCPCRFTVCLRAHSYRQVLALSPGYETARLRLFARWVRIVKLVPHHLTVKLRACRPPDLAHRDVGRGHPPLRKARLQRGAGRRRLA